MIGQHDAARANAHGFGGPRYVANQHRRGRAGNTWHVVMLGQPVALETQRFGVLSGAHGDVQRLRDSPTLPNSHQIQQGQLDIL